MENLNAEQVKKALECCHTPLASDCNDCGYRGQSVENGEYIGCSNRLMADALALITSQEQRIKELTEEYESMAKSVNEASDLIRKLKADKKGLIYENEELKNQIQEPFFTEEEIDFIDEYTRLLNEGIRDAKANNVSEIKTRFAMRFGTYTDKDMTPITEVFRLLDQIAKEMLEGE
jgi:hypothetical protein